MTTASTSATLLPGRRLAITLSLFVALQLQGQTVPALSADDAKYDANKNGVLDATELAVKADSEKNKDTVVLTPFEVSSQKDVGYAAGNTLSGGRVDTPLAITPGSISVMTKEFMDDFNITNMNEAGAWTIGFDLGTSVPNSDPSSISVYQNIVRGAPSTDNFPTRNGSINFGAADSYNTERFEFQRGPDTSMFGDGGPGGRQGSTSKRASYNRTATSISTQFDTWGGYRGTLDYSKGWDRTGLRFNAVYQNAPGYQAGTPKIKKAFTINSVTKLTKNTQLIAEYEQSRDWNQLWSITNGDAQSLWDGQTFSDTLDPLLANDNAALVARGVRRLTVEENGSAPNMFIYNFATNDMQDYGGNQYRTLGLSGTAIRIPYIGNKYLLAVPTRRPFISGIDKNFHVAPKDNRAARDGNTMSVNVEHRISNLFLRLGFVKNNFDNNTIWSNTSPNGYVLDVNKLLPNGKLNPGFQRAFTDVEQNNIYNEDAVKEYSALATYRFFVPRWWDYKQQLSANVSYREQSSENRTSAWRRTDNPTTVTTNGVAVTSFDPFNNANRFFYRVYWGDPRASTGPILTDPNGKVPGVWNYVDTGGGITEREVKHAGITSQSAFFNEKLAFTFSYSRDEVSVDNLPRFGSTGALGGYKNLLGFNAAGAHYTRTEKVSSAAAGVVAYPFQFRSDGILKTFLSPLGFVFNFAENNQPPSTNVQQPLINGILPPLTHSRTKDFGLRYAVPGGKFYLTVSTYRTNQVDNPSGFGSGGDIANIWRNLGYTDPKLITTTAGSGFNYSDPNSRRLEGWEVELTANPTRNITMQVTYSHPITYIVTESEDRKLYVAANRAEWQAGANAVQGQVLNGRTILDPSIIRDSLQAIDDSLNGLTTGTLENNAVRHRITVAASYRFREGMLNGLGFSAGGRYVGHGKNGSRDTQLKYGLPDGAATTLAQRTSAAYDYLWTPKAWKHTLTLGANYTRRFGKYSARFQINVTNLLDNLDPVWGRSGPVGNGASAYTTINTNQLGAGNVRQQVLTSFVNPDPRKFTFTTTLSF